jgi:hypothetical protein
MKKSELLKIIQEIINEVTQQTTIDFKDKNRGDKILDIDPLDTSTINKLKTDPNVSSATMGTKKIKEDNINEMANVGIKYMASPNLNMSKYPGKYGRILAALQNHDEPVTKLELADIMGLKRQQQINTEFMQLVNLGAIIPADTEFQKAKRILSPQTPSGEEESGTTEPEDETGIVSKDLSDEEIEASFAQAKAAGDDVDTTTTSQQTGGETPSSTSLSDEDYEAFMKFSDLSDRLSKVKSDLNRMKRAKFMKGGGDIKDKPSTEEKRLIDLKTSLEQRVDDLVAGSEYLQKRQSKKDELDEWVKNKWQYYAGIID